MCVHQCCCRGAVTHHMTDVTRACVRPDILMVRVCSPPKTSSRRLCDQVLHTMCVKIACCYAVMHQSTHCDKSMCKTKPLGLKAL